MLCCGYDTKLISNIREEYAGIMNVCFGIIKNFNWELKNWYLYLIKINEKLH